MNDYFKMFLIALVTTVATQLLLTPYVLRLQGLEATPMRTGTQAVSKVEQGVVASGTPLARPELHAPNLEGMTVNEARDRWRDQGLIIVEDGERAGDGAKPGSVVQQRPRPGSVLSSKEIRVIVAKASEEIKVPNIVGEPIDDARKTLVDAGFEVPPPKSEASEKKKGTVIRQLPNPGAKAKTGSMVRVVVAEPASVKVPKLRGMYLSKAKKALAEAGLTVGAVRRVEHPERGENYVLRQTPAPGDRVPPGTEIELTIVAPN